MILSWSLGLGKRWSCLWHWSGQSPVFWFVGHSSCAAVCPIAELLCGGCWNGGLSLEEKAKMSSTWKEGQTRVLQVWLVEVCDPMIKFFWNLQQNVRTYCHTSPFQSKWPLMLEYFPVGHISVGTNPTSGSVPLPQSVVPLCFPASLRRALQCVPGEWRCGFKQVSIRNGLLQPQCLARSHTSFHPIPSSKNITVH